MTTVYLLKCVDCGKRMKHGFAPPIAPQSCLAARQLRMRCKEPMRCRVELVSEERELSEIDRLRVGLRDERAIA